MMQHIICHHIFFFNYSRHETAPTLVDSEESTGLVTPGDWWNDSSSTSWTDFFPVHSNNYSREAKEICDQYSAYFNNEGAVSWRWRICGID